MLSRDSALVASRLRLGRRIGLDGPAEAAPIDTATASAASDDAGAGDRRDARGAVPMSKRRAPTSAAPAPYVGAERERYFPEISVGATTGAYDAELFPSALKRTQYAVSVAVPIWNGGKRELAVARARADRDVARAMRADRERAAGELMAQAYHGYITSRAGIELALIGVAAPRRELSRAARALSRGSDDDSRSAGGAGGVERSGGGAHAGPLFDSTRAGADRGVAGPPHFRHHQSTNPNDPRRYIMRSTVVDRVRQWSLRQEADGGGSARGRRDRRRSHFWQERHRPSAGGAAAGGGPPVDAADACRCGHCAYQPIVDAVRATGRIEAVQAVELRPDEQGRITALHVPRRPVCREGAPPW